MTIPGLTEAAIGDIDRAGGFPPSWGRPPGTAYSEERAVWIRSKLAEKLRYKAGWITPRA
jgi:hypothetical protein